MPIKDANPSDTAPKAEAVKTAIKTAKRYHPLAGIESGLGIKQITVPIRIAIIKGFSLTLGLSEVSSVIKLFLTT
jgi:hypothetical protein